MGAGEPPFEIRQIGQGGPGTQWRLYRYEQPLEPARDDYLDVCRDLLNHGGTRPHFQDGTAGFTPDGGKCSWPLLERLAADQ